MWTNKFAVAAIGAACIAAAGTGGYLALRRNPAPAAAPQSTPAPLVAAPIAGSDVAEKGVQETEAVVGDTRPAPTPKPAPQANNKRSETPARSGSSLPSSSPKPARAQSTPAPDPKLDHAWPSGAATSSSSSSTPLPAAAPTVVDTTPAAVHNEDRTAHQETTATEPPQKTFEELVVSADSVIGLQNETAITSERARVEDRVEARVTRDVKVGDKVAIPAGARALGVVTQVDRGGKFKERARLGVRFQSIVLADGTRLAISTEPIVRVGDAPGNESAAKIGGGAVGGAIIGAIIGGAKGAAIGGMTGAGAGTAVVAAGDRNAATLRAGEPITVRLQAPVTVTTETPAR